MLNNSFYEHPGLEASSGMLNVSAQSNTSTNDVMGGSEMTNTAEGALVREVLYGAKENVNFVHEVYRQAFLLSFSHSPAIKKVISVYKDWIQMNVPELPPFLLEPVDNKDDGFKKAIGGDDTMDGICLLEMVFGLDFRDIMHQIHDFFIKTCFF